jgi:hypothetical protein
MDESSRRRRAEKFDRVARISTGVKSFEAWACVVCGALVAPDATDRHVSWHQSLTRS